jgi:hypothetical protein
MYMSNEAGLSSPAVVNDVVFVSTHKTALYALDINTGLCLWSAPGLPPGGWPVYSLGPTIYGNYVVVGAGNIVYIYRLARSPVYTKPPEILVPWWELIGPWPGPDPIRDLRIRPSTVSTTTITSTSPKKRKKSFTKSRR